MSLLAPRRLALVVAFAAVLLVPSAWAQTTADVTGTVLDASDGQPLPGATVFLVSATPDSARTGAAAGLDGTFQITVPTGSYRLRISFVGYEPLDRELIVDGPLALGSLSLSSDAAALGDVEVAATRQRVEVRGDTTAFNADAFPVNPDASAQDLLAKIPGVIIENGDVSVQGETVQRVLVDGREFFGTDVQGALNSLPAEMVQEVQVFDRASDASRFSGFDDGNAEKTVNIVTRAGMQNGQFGRAYAGAGAGGEYLTGGNISAIDGDRRITVVAIANNVDQQNFATEDLLGIVGSTSGRRGGGGRAGGGGRRGGGGSADVSNLLVADQDGLNTTNAVGVNLSDVLLNGALNLTGSYVYNSTDNDLDASLARDYTTGNAITQRYAEIDASDGTNANHQLALRAQYNISDRTQLIVEPKVTAQNSETLGTLVGLTSAPSGDALAQSLTTDAVDASALSAQASVLLRHRFEAVGRTLTVGVDANVDDQAGESQQATVLDSFSGTIAASNTDQLFDTDALSRSVGATVRYTEPVGERGQIQLNYQPELSWRSSDQLAFLADEAGAYTIPDASYTSLFTQQSMVQRGGVSYRYSAGGRDALSAQIGVDVQNERLQGEQTATTSFDVDRTFWSVLPSARLRLPLGEGQRIDLDYRARTQTPSARQLQSVVDNSNPLLLSSGNPDLDLATTHSLRARFNGTDPEGGSVLSAFVSGSYGINSIGTSITTALVDTELPSGVVLPAGTQLAMPVNVDGAWDARAFVVYGRPVPSLGSNANLSFGPSFSRTPGLVNGITNVADQLGVDGRISLGSAVSPRVDVSVEYGARYTAVSNSAAPTLDSDYVRHLAGAKVTWLPWEGLVLGTDLQALHYSGLDTSVDPTQVLLGAKVGYKFLQDDLAEVSLSISDIFNQQRDVERTVTESYIQDAQTAALGRYVMLNLSYKLRNFGL